MNNSWLVQDVELTLDTYSVPQEVIEEQVSEMVRVLEAVREVQKSKAWRTLKELVFSGLAESLLTELTREARRDSPDVLKLAKLSGQLRWAERYADLTKLEEEYKVRLSSIKRNYGTTQENPG